MNNYSIIDNLPPMNFREQTTKGVRRFGTWFKDNKEKRLEILQQVFHDFSGHYLDFSPESLLGLADFMSKTITFERMSPEEFDAELTALLLNLAASAKLTIEQAYGGDLEKAKDQMRVNKSDRILSKESESLIIDLGIYLGEVMVRNHTELTWSQVVQGSKRSFDYGQMVIKINEKLKYRYTWYSPIQKMTVFAREIINGTFDRNAILKNYNHYCAYIGKDEIELSKNFKTKK